MVSQFKEFDSRRKTMLLDVFKSLNLIKRSRHENF